MRLEMTELSNGLPVIFSPAPGTPRTCVCIGVAGGARTQRLPGLAALATRLLLKGTPSRTAAQIAEELDRRAIAFDEIPAPEHLMLRATCLNAQLEPALDLMADVLQHSTFDDLPKESALLAGEIQSGLDLPRERARDLFVRTMFPDHPYGHTGSLVLEALPRMDVELVRAWYCRQLAARSMNIVVVGDLSLETLLPVLEARFGGIPRSGGALEAPPFVPRNGRVVATEVKSDAQQAQICQGWYAPGHSSPDRAPLAALNTVLGAGGLSSRLFVELRDRRGLAYAVRSGYSTYSDTGLFGLYIGTSPDNIGRALEGFAEQIGRLCEEEIPEAEVEHAKGHLQGEFVLGHETNTQRCTDFAVHHILGLGVDFSARLLERILAARPADLLRVARAYLAREPVTTIVAPEDALAGVGA